MQKSDLSFSYPPELVATEPKTISRVMWSEKGDPREISKSGLLTQIEPHDVLVINDTRVIPARVISDEGLEILFIEEKEPFVWEVLCPLRKWPKGKDLTLPGGVQASIEKKGLPQQIRVNQKLDITYFQKWGQMPLPPYIQEARGERQNRSCDVDDYQTDWAENLGSLAAPTASLHFSKEDLQKVRNRGAQVLPLSLHVGLGTFLPIHADSLDEHQMHGEFVFIPKETWLAVSHCKQKGGRVWALGSTVTRALESQALDFFQATDQGFHGQTQLFIRPGFDFKVVDCLMTNFHQPESTLVAMVMAFAGVEETKKCYQWAIDHRFRLFSYGDLSLWTQ